MKAKLALTLVFCLALLSAACGGAAPPVSPGQEEATSPPAAEATSAGSALLRIGWGGSPDSLNPGIGLLLESYAIYEIVYDSMYSLNLDGTYSLELAESAEMSEDGKTWTFTLHDGVKFHDGEDLTAEDVVFSYEFYASHEDFPYMNVYTGYFESVEAPDPRTVVINLSEPIPNMESQLIFLYVLPRHIWEAYEGEAASEFENMEMIGSGPFRLTEYRQNEFVHLTAVKDHFLYPPKIDEVVFQTFENQDALVQAIRTGQVDMITEMPNTAVASLRNAENVEVVTGSPLSPSLADIIFNQVSEENCPPDDGVCSGHPALRDRQVRLALAHATDKQKIIDVVLLGLGEPGLTLVPSGLGIWYNDQIEDYAFDIALANQILDEAGYLDQDGDGIREMPDGSQPLTFRMNWPSDNSTAPRMAELLNEMWSEIGIGLEQQALDPDALTAICCPTFDYDILLWSWGSDPDPAFLLSVHLTDEIPTGSSETGYSNPEFDDLFARQATALDPEERKEIIWEMQRILHEDVVYVVPYYEEEVQAYRTDRFQGWITGAPKVALEDVTSLVVVEPVR